MQGIAVRKATMEDLATLNLFQQGIADAERVFDPAIKDGAVQYYDIASMLTADDTRFVIAQAGTRIVGCGYARIEAAKHYLKHSVHAYLGLMYVDPQYRGHSVNLAIIEALKDWSLSRGVGEMRLEVYRDNIAAIKAYEKAGFGQWVIEMRWAQNDGGGRQKLLK
ncbi:MAG TPA: GNAT family N-acetyltransferase [Steroidobacteraceae bacterium]|jgi:GNAT superfamily N-acetyltransferase|nr:GNAT family N-acetyltransferase [Steroidobacteraceae bacterium]